MPRYSGSPTNVVAHGQTYTFPPRTIDDFSDAAGFLTGLLDRGRVASHVAKTYVQTVARLRRAGRLADLSLLHNRIERTAANAYLRWYAEAYAARVAPVVHAFASKLPNKNAVRWLRVHALVPPFEGKTTAVRTPAPPDPAAWEKVRAGVVMPAQEMVVTLRPSHAYTLHVPAKLGAAHVDPCDTCHTIELTAADLEVLAVAFESAWGHRDINKVPRDAYLFGEPPPEAASEVVKDKGEKIAALAMSGVTGDELARIGAAVARDVEGFVARLMEGADGVYLSKSACGVQLVNVLDAVAAAWGGGA
jgi:hypothetical protein